MKMENWIKWFSFVNLGKLMRNSFFLGTLLFVLTACNGETNGAGNDTSNDTSNDMSNDTVSVSLEFGGKRTTDNKEFTQELGEEPYTFTLIKNK